MNKISKPLTIVIKKTMWNFPSSIVLMFHHITKKPKFKKSQCTLDSKSFNIVVNRFENFVSCERLISSKINTFKNRVAITFDDGLEDVYAIAYPMLKNKDIPFTIFIVTEFLDTEGYITTEQLIEMSNDPLVTVGAHGVSHEMLLKLSSEQRWEEISGSKKRLEKLINREIRLFAYSHGQYDNECIEMVKEAGYRGAFGARGLPFNFYSKKWKYYLPRYNVVEEEMERINDIINNFLK